MTSRILAALMIGLFVTIPATAHDIKTQHGGRAVEAGEYHVEMVAKGGTIDVFLADHNNKAIPASGHKGVAILVIDGKSQRIVLEPAGAARLSGKAAGALPASPKGVVQITPPGGKAVQARFN